MKKIILTGGGTAGHIMPNIALIPYLDGYELHYIGQPDSMEEELIKKLGNVEFHPLKCVKLSRSFDLKNLAIPFKLAKSRCEAKKIIKRISPSVIFSKGGFVSLPVVLSSGKVPVILHESDYSMGLANKLSVKKCKYVLTSFEPLSREYENGICTGSPLRQTIYSGSRKKGEELCGLKNRVNLLIFGGSLGSVAINNAVESALDELLKTFNVVHITGKNNSGATPRPGYTAIPFTGDIADYFAWADVVVSRGGANACFELAALKKPSLIIPLGNSASRGDQADNAEYFKKLGCFYVLYEKNLSGGTLLDAVIKTYRDRNYLKVNMEKAENIDGTKKIAELIKKTAESELT